MPATVRQLLTAVRAVLVLTVLLGVLYPLVVLGVGRLALTQQAQGSLVVHDGQVVGSSLIGQRFDGDQWFQPRPSAGDYDGLASGGTNAGPNDGELAATIEQRRAEIAAARRRRRRRPYRSTRSPPRAPAWTRSSRPAYAEQQVSRVAAARDLAPDEVQALVRRAHPGADPGVPRPAAGERGRAQPRPCSR